MHDVTVLIVELAATIAVSAWIVQRDLNRLEPRLLSRAWPEPSLWAAVVCFSPICVLLHFVRTRRSLGGLALGACWFSLALVTVESAAWLVDAVLGG